MDDEYRAFLAECGFGEAVIYPSLDGNAGGPRTGLIAILSQKKRPDP